MSCSAHGCIAELQKRLLTARASSKQHVWIRDTRRTAADGGAAHRAQSQQQLPYPCSSSSTAHRACAPKLEALRTAQVLHTTQPREARGGESENAAGRSSQQHCPAGPGAGRARVLVAAGPVCRRAIRTPRWWSTRWAPGQARRICASAGCCGGGRRVGTGVGCGESAAAGRRGHGCGGSGGVWAWGAERRLALGVGSVAAVWARRTWASVCGLRRRASAASLAPGR